MKNLSEKHTAERADDTKEGRSMTVKFNKMLKSPTVRKHGGDLLAYTFLSIGLIICFFSNFIGGLFVGCITGLYFSERIISLFHEFQEFILAEGIFRGFVIVVAALSLAILAPGLLVGLIVGSMIRPLFKGHLTGEQSKKGKKGDKKDV